MYWSTVTLESTARTVRPNQQKSHFHKSWPIIIDDMETRVLNNIVLEKVK